jgi:hypothetical protein
LYFKTGVLAIFCKKSNHTICLPPSLITSKQGKLTKEQIFRAVSSSPKIKATSRFRQKPEI